MRPSSPPIGLRSIEITDFRKIDQLSFDFTNAQGGASDIAVIGGPNGCGKTAILESCLIAIGYKGNLVGAKGPSAARSGRKMWKIIAEVQTAQARYRVETTSNSDLSSWYNLDKNLACPQPAEIPCLYFSSWRAPRLMGALSITAGKPGNRPKDTERNRIWRAKQHLIDSRAHKLMSQGVFPEFIDHHEEDLRRLNDVWATFHPNAEERFIVEPVSSDPNAGFDVFLFGKNGQKVPVDALSSGELELFALFGALMLVNFKAGILVIDEPELHLDPQWHALMVRAIRRFLPSAQLIIATHSPRVFDSVMSFQRHFLLPDSDPRALEWEAQPLGAA